ncbi:glutathione S-transferase theta-2 [Tachysurus fulvidraco]|uniref:glutathione S-transferase theta-2 n=1 Tax=Tachysurus fulvidraco TaxID=1234273 RepID=UPI000F50D343|nr:glutathione S-transferase theta-2 [Tachysurus fulvidraco]
MLQVFVDLMSQPCRALIIFLTVNKIPHTVRTVALRKGQNRTPEFIKLNPMQKVPVMEKDGFILTESDAILKYLTAAYRVPDHWYPQQTQKRARVDEYMAWHHMNTRLHASKVFITEVLIPRLSGKPVDDVKLQRALWDLETTLDKLETMFLKDTDFLCGDDLTLADLLAVCELMQPLAGGRDVLMNRPRLQEWKSRIQSVLGDSFDQAHKILYRVKDKHISKL